MLTRVKSAVTHFMGGMVAPGANGDHPGAGGSDLPLKFPYMRPEFLGLSLDEMECSADHGARPILILKESHRLPWATGYAEVINAGKSSLNEDQACCQVLTVKPKPPASGGSSSGGGGNQTPTSRRRSSLPNGEGLGLRESQEVCEGLTLHYWALFDGHAGSGAAVAATRQLHGHIAQHLQEVLEILRLPAQPPPTCMGEEPLNHHLHHHHHHHHHQQQQQQQPQQPQQNLTPNSQRSLTRAASLRGAAGAPGPSSGTPPPQTRFFTEKKVSHESLVVGALENAFKDMDVLIEKDKAVYNMSGGCTALVVLYLLGKLAVIIRSGEVIAMSTEFTPESERQRLQFLAYMHPHLLGNEFTHLEFARRVQKKEVGKRMLYRDFTMSGWAYKNIEEEDLKFPLIYGEGKKARVLATIGVTRGLGDHDLKVHDSNIFIKPFLSCCPE
ncbi:hypothetical protein NHX12_003328, partial [Muraenolepis orangiensis]